MGTGFTPGAWSTFFSAQTGASAGLAGLIFVAVSINLMKIVELPHLVARCAKALLSLIAVLITSLVCLVPGQPIPLLAAELLGLGLLFCIVITIAERATVRGNSYINRRQRIFHFIFAQLSTLPYAAAGLSLGLGFGGGLYWLVAAISLSYVTALIDAWVLLIEILR